MVKERLCRYHRRPSWKCSSVSMCATQSPSTRGAMPGGQPRQPTCWMTLPGREHLARHTSSAHSCTTQSPLKLELSFASSLTDSNASPQSRCSWQRLQTTSTDRVATPPQRCHPLSSCAPASCRSTTRIRPLSQSCGRAKPTMRPSPRSRCKSPCPAILPRRSSRCIGISNSA